MLSAVVLLSSLFPGPGEVVLLEPADATTSSYAEDIAGDGSVVVGSLSRSDGLTTAFVARCGAAEVALVDVGPLQGRWAFSQLVAVSSDGRFAAGVFAAQGVEPGSIGPQSGMRIALQSVPSFNDVTVMPDLPGGAVQGFAADLNGDGSVLVGASYDAGDDFVPAWFDVAADALLPLPMLASVPPRGDARAVSDDGARVLYGSPRTAGGLTTSRCALVDVTGGVAGDAVDIGTLPNAPIGALCFANDISADGSVVVASSSSAQSTANSVVAVRAREANGWQLEILDVTGDLAGGPSYADALAVSASGRVIVGRSAIDADENEHAWVYTDDVGMVDLNSLASGFDGVLAQARGVSADGSVVVGNALVDGATGPIVRGFVMRLPESIPRDVPASTAQPRPTIATAGGCDATGVPLPMALLCAVLVCRRRTKVATGRGPKSPSPG